MGVGDTAQDPHRRYGRATSRESSVLMSLTQLNGFG